jgi:hypothetical protein
MADQGALATVASIVAALGTLVLAFRIQRELTQQGERTGIPWADRLLIGATLISLLLVVLPLVALPHPWPSAVALERAACVAGVIMLGGYVFALLAHHRSLWSGKPAGPSNNPEPAERMAFWITLVVAAAVFACLFVSTYGSLNEPSL